MQFDILREKLIEFLSHALNEQEKNVETLSDAMIILGVKQEIFHLSYLLRPSLEILINNKHLDESSRRFFSDEYFQQPEDKYDVAVLMKYPVFGFNYEVQKHVGYKYYGYELSTLLNDLEKSKKRISNNQKYKFSLNSRKFIKYFSTHFDDEFFSRHTLMKIREYIIINKLYSLKDYSFFDSLNVLILSGQRDGREVVLTREYELSSYDGRKSYNMFERLKTKSRSKITNEQDIGEYELLSKNSNFDKSPYNRYLELKYRSLAIQKSNVDFIGSLALIGLNEINALYNEYKTDEKTIKQAVIASVIVSAHTGIKYFDIFSLVSQNLEGKRFNIGSELKYKLDTRRKKLKDELHQVAEYALGEVLIQFPSKIRYLISSIRSFVEKNNPTGDVIEHEFNLLVKRLKQRSSVTINADRIANFFKIYYPEKYGLDRLLIQYISMDILTNSITAQHYTIISSKLLYERYSDTFSKCDAELPLRLPIKEVKIETSKFGSANVPKKEYVINLFKDIRENYQTITGEVNKFNLRSYYMYMLLMLLTGARPITNPTYGRNTTSLFSLFTIMMDKRSKNYLEFRNQPICGFIVKEFEAYINANKKMFNKVEYVSFGISHFGPDRNTYLFLLNTAKKSCDFSSENLKQLVFPLLIQKHNLLRPNFLRHYFRNYLFNRNESYEFINSCMGHIKNGQEMFNKFSSVELSDYRKKVICIQEEIILEHGLESLFA